MRLESELSLSKLEHNIALKGNSVTSRDIDSKVKKSLFRPTHAFFLLTLFSFLLQRQNFRIKIINFWAPSDLFHK